MNLNNLSDIDLKKEEVRMRSIVSQLNNTQMSLKILLNSLYGALGSKYFRWFDLRLASAITLSGQLSIKWIEKYLMEHPQQKKYGWNIIYSDTDSSFLELSILVSKLQQKNPDITQEEIVNKLDSFMNKIVLPIVKEGYNELAEYMNVNENRMFMAREKIMTCFHPKSIISDLNISIEELYNLIEDKPVILNDKEIKQLKLNIKSCNIKTKKEEDDIITAISKKKYSGYMYKFEIDEKILEVTENHLLAIKRNNKIIWKKAKNILEEDELILGSEINNNDSGYRKLS